MHAVRVNHPRPTSRLSANNFFLRRLKFADTNERFFLVSWLICRQISEFYQQLLLRLTACFQKKTQRF